MDLKEVSLHFNMDNNWMNKNTFCTVEITHQHPSLHTGMRTIVFSLGCHVGKIYCMKIMEHFVNCITGFTSRCATSACPRFSFPPSLLLILQLSFPICFCFSPLLSLALCLFVWLSPFFFCLSGAVMSIHSKAERFEVQPNGTLVIHNVQLQDRGTYICSANSFLGRDR